MLGSCQEVGSPPPCILPVVIEMAAGTAYPVPTVWDNIIERRMKTVSQFTYFYSNPQINKLPSNHTCWLHKSSQKYNAPLGATKAQIHNAFRFQCELRFLHLLKARVKSLLQNLECWRIRGNTHWNISVKALLTMKPSSVDSERGFFLVQAILPQKYVPS